MNNCFQKILSFNPVRKNTGTYFLHRIGKIFFAFLFLLSIGSHLSAQLITSKAVTGNWSNPTTWPGKVVPTAGADVVVADGAIITIDQDVPALHSLTIGQGRSGILRFDSTLPRTIMVSGGVKITANGLVIS